MTRKEKQAQNEILRENYKGILMRCLVSSFNKSYDMDSAWKKTYRYMKFIMFKEPPQRKCLIESAYYRLKTEVKSADRSQGARAEPKMPVYATSPVGANIE